MAIQPNSTPTLDVCARLTPFKVEERSRGALGLKTCEGSDVPLSLTIQQESNARIEPTAEGLYQAFKSRE
jgi:hypothetical protein